MICGIHLETINKKEEFGGKKKSKSLIKKYLKCYFFLVRLLITKLCMNKIFPASALFIQSFRVTNWEFGISIPPFHSSI